MKVPSALLPSLATTCAALLLILSARHALFGGYDRQGTLLLYCSWVMAVGGAELLVVYRRAHQKPSSCWVVVALLLMFAYFGLS